jgi:hypothetical protein
LRLRQVMPARLLVAGTIGAIPLTGLDFKGP